MNFYWGDMNLGRNGWGDMELRRYICKSSHQRLICRGFVYDFFFAFALTACFSWYCDFGSGTAIKAQHRSNLLVAYEAHQGLVPGRSSYTGTYESVVMLTLNSWAPWREAITTIFKYFVWPGPGIESRTSRTIGACSTTALPRPVYGHIRSQSCN